MNDLRTSAPLWIAIVFGALFLQSISAFFPAIILASVGITFLFPRPFLPLVLFAIIAELYSFSQVGVVIGICLVPIIVGLFFPRIEIDLSFSYAGLLTLVVAIQLGCLLILDHSGVVSLVQNFPVVIAALTLSLCVFLLMATTVMYHFNRKARI